MIESFTNKLPQKLASSIQNQYDAFLPIFTNYARSEGNQYYKLIETNYKLSCYFLGMALFYKNVIIPMSSGSNAFIGFKTENITAVKVGNYTLTNIDRREIRAMERDFNIVLAKYQIPTYLLLFSDVKNFARDLNSFFSYNYE